MIQRALEQRDPKTLKNHLLNIKIYGTQTASQKLVESVKRDGVIEPLVILPNGTIIAGHSRRQAAVINKLETVPCWVRYDLADQPLLVERLIILSNCQRIRSGDVLAREAAALATIESALAAGRQRQNLKIGTQSPVGAEPPRREKPGEFAKIGSTTEPLSSAARQRQNLKIGAQSPVGAEPPRREKPGEFAKNDPATDIVSSSGRTKEIVAERLGIGQKKAEQAIKVGQAIEDAEQKGDTEKAEQIIRAAKTSLPKAVKLITPPKSEPELALPPAAKEVERLIGKISHQLEAARKTFDQLFPAIDELKCASRKFGHQRHDKFVKAMRTFCDAIDKSLNEAGAIKKLWADTKALKAI